MRREAIQVLCAYAGIQVLSIFIESALLRCRIESPLRAPHLPLLRVKIELPSDLSPHSMAVTRGKVFAMSQTIRVKPTHDGTYTVYRGTEVLVSGLTRPQAERYEADLALLASLVAANPPHGLTV